MFSCDESVRGSFRRIEVDVVLDSLLDAIDALPQRRDSRSDPIFEPHYKLVSVVHKLVHRGTLTVCESLILKPVDMTDSPLRLRREAKRSWQHLGLAKSSLRKTRRHGRDTYSRCFGACRKRTNQIGTIVWLSGYVHSRIACIILSNF